MNTTSEPPAPGLLSGFPFEEEAGSLVDSVEKLRARVLDYAVDHPLEALITLVLGSAWAFYRAERDENPGVNTYDDAVYYVSTCLSVGYANIFPVTQAGKFIAAVVMMVGPSLTNWVVEGRLVRRSAETEAPPEVLGPKLDAILEELRARRVGDAGDGPGGGSPEAG